MTDIGNVFIIGDSYSTFEGFIPAGYENFYGKGSKEDWNIDAVEQTWWHRLLAKTNGKLILNDSYSGSTICNTGYNGEDAEYKGFTTRFDKYTAEGLFEKNKIDTLLIFGGTNDSWANAPVGELKYSDLSKEDLKSATPAFCYLLKRATEILKDTRTIVILNTDLNPQLTENYLLAARHYGVETICLENITKVKGHPTDVGMEQICEQLYNFLSLKVKK